MEPGTTYVLDTSGSVKRATLRPLVIEGVAHVLMVESDGHVSLLLDGVIVWQAEGFPCP